MNQPDPGAGHAGAAQPGAGHAGAAQPGALPQPGPVPWPGPYPPYRRTSTSAVAAMVVSLAGLATCPLVGLVGVYLGNRARAEIRRTGEDGDGMALAGIIIGWCGAALGILIIVVLGLYFGFLAAFLAFGPGAAPGY